MDNPEFNFEVAEEVKHLSSEEIEEVYARYMAGEKNSVLVREYKISVSPNRLINFLPPKLLYETLCVYCGTPMLKRRRSKTAGVYGAPPAECYHCGHKVYEEGRSWGVKSCDCKACINLVKERELKELEEKRYKILALYDVSHQSALHYDKLGFFQKLVLLTLLRMQTGENFEFIQPLDDLSKSEHFTPTRKMDVDSLSGLYQCNALIVDPLSPINSFSEKDNFESFYTNKVRWIPNVTLNGKERAEGEALFNAIYQELRVGVRPGWESELSDLLYKIAQEEVLQYIECQAEELNVTFVAEDKTRRVTRQLLHDFSVSEIYYFAKKSVENAHLYYSKGLAKNKRHAANTIPNKMLSLGERALNEGWNTYKYNRISRVPRSHISRILYDFLIQDEDAGFTKATGLYWKEELYPKYFSTGSEDTGNKLYCIQCGSDAVTVRVVGAGLEQVCNGCGDVVHYVHTK